MTFENQSFHIGRTREPACIWSPSNPTDMASLRSTALCAQPMTRERVSRSPNLVFSATILPSPRTFYQLTTAWAETCQDSLYLSRAGSLGATYPGLICITEGVLSIMV